MSYLLYTLSLGPVSINISVVFDKQSFGKKLLKTYSEGIFFDLWSKDKEYKEAKQQEEESKDDLNTVLDKTEAALFCTPTHTLKKKGGEKRLKHNNLYVKI